MAGGAQPDTTPDHSLGGYLARRAAEQGLSQSEVARRVGVDKSAVSNWFKGANSPDPGNLKKLARVLDTNLEHLVVLSQRGKNFEEFVRQHLEEQHEALRWIVHTLRERVAEEKTKVAPLPPWILDRDLELAGEVARESQASARPRRAAPRARTARSSSR